MDIDTQRIRALLDKRDGIDEELQQALGGIAKKPITCSLCNTQGHSARSCPTRVQSP
jgi:hypothetical protein